MGNRKGLYKTELLQLAINGMWFAKATDEGVIHHDYFNPIPKVTMALVLAVVRASATHDMHTKPRLIG